MLNTFTLLLNYTKVQVHDAAWLIDCADTALFVCSRYGVGADDWTLSTLIGSTLAAGCTGSGVIDLTVDGVGDEV